MIIYNKISKFTKKEQEYIKDLTEFVCEKFFTSKMRENLDINVVFHRNYEKKEGVLGDCVWEDCHYRGREFTVNVDRNPNFALLLNTLAHELVHVKQHAKGELYELQRRKNYTRFKGKTYSTKRLDYWDYPWEIEAHGMAIGLINQWAKKRNFSSKTCDKVIF
jgi:hypothetical protein